MERTDSIDRNYNTISPSAKSLLLMKGLTNIPFARQAAELMMLPEKYNPDIDNKDMGFWARLVHFEHRYWSIDQLLAELPIKNILELSSGFSFRGLAMVKQNGIHYIDTDLPEVIKTKKPFINALQDKNPNEKSKLETFPLNALDEKQFQETVACFPKGKIIIINEGLLMYLDTNEKKKLCSIIHKILKQRGGYWITADIYIKKQLDNLDLKIDDRTKEFFEQHRIEDNKFESFLAAEAFFKKAGFVIDREAQSDHLKMSSLNYLLKSATTQQLSEMQKTGKIQATWRLRVATD